MLAPEASRQIKRLCVFCGSSPGVDPAYRAAAAGLAQVMVQRDIALVYGGGRVGLMGEIADRVLEGGGTVTGVIPAALDRREVSHRGVTRLEVVGSMHERKARMAALADAFVALPGGLGTFEELIEAATWTQLGLHDKPIGLLDVRGFWRPLEAVLDHAAREGFIAEANRGLIVSGDEPEPLLNALARWRRPAGGPWLADATQTSEDTRPRGPLVGTSAFLVRDGRLLLTRRRGAHGAGTWAPPGGRVDAGERPGDAVRRELLEETGLVAEQVEPIGWTDDVMDETGRHHVTLHHVVTADGEPELREPGKAEPWTWHAVDALPEPLFAPVASLLATGWRP
jgi:uncharacterized protein (TIGR00730 family)